MDDLGKEDNCILRPEHTDDDDDNDKTNINYIK